MLPASVGKWVVFLLTTYRVSFGQSTCALHLDDEVEVLADQLIRVIYPYVVLLRVLATTGRTRDHLNVQHAYLCTTPKRLKTSIVRNIQIN